MALTLHEPLDFAEILSVLQSGHQDCEAKDRELLLRLAGSFLEHFDDRRVTLGRHVELSEHLLRCVDVEALRHGSELLIAARSELQRVRRLLLLLELQWDWR